MKRLAAKILLGVCISSLIVIAVLAGLFTFQMWRVGLWFHSPVYETEAPHLPEGLSRPAVLVFTKTNGFRHIEGIPASVQALNAIASDRGWTLYHTSNAAVHQSELLGRFDVIIWSNVSGDVLTENQRTALVQAIEGGIGWVGIHASGGDPEYQWRWYVEKLIGAQFTSHPMFPQFQSAKLLVENQQHPATQHLGSEWMRIDEWYNFAASVRNRDGYQVLVSIDETTYDPQDNAMGVDHPMVWHHDQGRGRVFYSALGHTPESYIEPEYRALLAGAIGWAGRLTEVHAATEQ